MQLQQLALQHLAQQQQAQVPDGKNTAITTISMVAFLSHTTIHIIMAMVTTANQNSAKFGFGAQERGAK